jgi:hypothetical protein
MAQEEGNSDELVEKILNQVHSSGKARKTLRKVLEQPKVLKFLKVRAKETGESIDNLAYKFALEAKESIDDRQIEKDHEEEINAKTKVAEDRLMKALDGEGGADILNKTSKVFGGDTKKARASLVSQTRKVARKEAIKAIKQRQTEVLPPTIPAETSEETEVLPPAIPAEVPAIPAETSEEKVPSEEKVQRHGGACWLPSIPAGTEFPKPNPMFYWGL